MRNKEKNRFVLALVEDQGLREEVKTFLQQADYQCEASSSEQAPPSQLASCQYDLVIIELSDKGIPNTSTLAWLNEGPTDTPKVLLVENANAVVSTKLLEVPVIGVLSKPIDFPLLISTVAHGLKRLNEIVAIEHCANQIENSVTEIQQKLEPADHQIAEEVHYVRRKTETLQEQVEKLETRTSSEPTPEEAPENFEEAIERTVEVLDRTRRHFKSRDLRDLRRYLEDFLRHDSRVEQEG